MVVGKTKSSKEAEKEEAASSSSSKAASAKGNAHQKNKEGVAAFAKGSFKEAIACFSEVEDILRNQGYATGSEEQTRELAVALVNKARSQLFSGNLVEAEADALVAARVDVNYCKSRQLLEEIWQKTGRSRSAKELAADLVLPPRTDPQKLGALISSAAKRSLFGNILLLLVIAGALYVYRRPAFSAFNGVEEVMRIEDFPMSLQFSGGFGFANSFRGRVQPDQVEECSVASAGVGRLGARDWQDFLYQAVGSKRARPGGRMLLLSWRGELAAEKKKVKQGKGAPSKACPAGWRCVLAHLAPGADQPSKLDVVRSTSKLELRATRGRFVRLGYVARSWLQRKLPGEDDNLVPLLFEVDGVLEADLQVPGYFLQAQAMLAVAALLSVMFLRGAWGGLAVMREFRRHPAYIALARYSHVASDPERVARQIEEELNETSQYTSPRMWDSGHVVITCSWLITCADGKYFVRRLFQPLLIMLGWLGSDSSQPQPSGPGQPSTPGQGAAATTAGGPPSMSGLLGRCVSALFGLPSWVKLVYHSIPGTVVISPLEECQLGLRRSPSANAPVKVEGDAAKATVCHQQAQLVVWDPVRGNMAECLGELSAMEEIALETAARQAVSRKVRLSTVDAEAGGVAVLPMEEGSNIDPRSMSLDVCYEALKLRRDEMQCISKEEFRLRLGRAFKERVLCHPNCEKDEVARAALALDVMLRRLYASLEM